MKNHVRMGLPENMHSFSDNWKVLKAHDPDNLPYNKRRGEYHSSHLAAEFSLAPNGGDSLTIELCETTTSGDAVTVGRTISRTLSISLRKGQAERLAEFIMKWGQS